MGCRIYVSDVQESVYMVRYKRNENQLIIFADDTQPRYITAMEILDYNTVATADKCGNISVVCNNLNIHRNQTILVLVKCAMRKDNYLSFNNFRFV